MSEVYVKEPTTNGKAIFRTTHGDLEVELWATEAPKACRNFCQLILEGYYNGTIFHRVIKDFIIQGGDGTNTGDGSESIYGSPYPDEIHPRLKFRYRGMMGVASAGRGTKTNGSQFFIVLNRAPSLDGKHTLFGKVVGQTVYNLVRMSEVEVDKKDRPFDPPRILRAELVWNPFDDLEPRRMPSPPRSAGGSGAGEAHRRAPIRNKKVLSFNEEDADSDEDAGGGGSSSSAAKGKSAHDLLADPKLSKEKAYPEQKPQGRQAPADGKAKADASSVSKRAAAAAAGASLSKPNAVVRATTSKKAAAKGGGSSDDSDSDSEIVDFGGDDSSEEGDTVTKKKSVNRREAINRLKREIAAVGNEPEEDQSSKKRRPGSALEELRAGYQAREPRVKATGKEGKRMEADAMQRTLKDFRSRLSAFASQADDGSDEEEKAEKAEKEKAERDKKEKDKKEKDKKDKKKKKDKDGEKKSEPEDGTFAAIWAEGDEEADKDWLTGGGLKFHVTADKAFKLDRDRARETLDIFDPLAAKGNSEVLADARKKASDKMVPQRRKFAKEAKEKGDDDREPFRR